MSYNWEYICSQKTDTELIEMVKNKYYLDEFARYHALNELNKRHVIFDNRIVESLKTDLTSSLVNLKKSSFNELILKINPYLILPLAFYMMIEYLNSLLKNQPDRGYLFFMVFFYSGTIVSGFYSYFRLKRIRKSKRVREKNLTTILKEINKVE
jgi:hypothetical protein